jgi:putative Holliday junction resolvase
MEITSSSSPLPHWKRPAGRTLALDVGNRRIGVAVSDEAGVTAQPVLTLVRKNKAQDIRSLSRLIRKFQCREIVVGYPLRMSGEPGPQAGIVEAFAQVLGDETGLVIHLWDERLSTAEAHRLLDQAGRASNDRKAVIDQVAAVLILQSFLDARAHS